LPEWSWIDGVTVSSDPSLSELIDALESLNVLEQDHLSTEEA
jgi:hypothetical protein